MRELLAVQDIDGSLSAHDGNLRGRPSQVDVGAKVLGPHHVVGTAIGLAGDHRDQRNGRLRVGIDQLRPTPDDAAPLLVGPGQEARHVDKGQDRDVERIAGSHKARRLLRGGDVERAGELHRLVRDHSHGAALHPAEADQEVRGVQRLHLEELTVVEHLVDDLMHVIGDIRAVRDDRVQEPVAVIDVQVVLLAVDRRVLHVVGGQIGQQRLDVLDGVLFVGAHVVRIARGRIVRAGAAELLEADILAGDGLDDVRSGDEHVRGLVDHDGEVGNRGGVDRATRAWAHDQRNLRDDPRGVHIAAEDLAVQPERDHTLLDARATGVIDPNDRAAHLHGKVHDLDDLLAEHLAQRPTKDREVLRKDGDRPPVNRAIPSDHAVAIRTGLVLAECRGAVPRVLVHLDEGAFVQQQGNALASGLLAAGMLLLDRSV